MNENNFDECGGPTIDIRQLDMFVWQKRLGNANNSLSCGGTIYSCHIRVQTMMAPNLQIMSISQDYGVHPSHVKYLIRNSCNVFSG